MRLLIDGYNLLHATDIFGRGAAAGTLRGARDALIAVVANAMSASQRRATTMVFDAAGAPPGLPAMSHHDHLTIRFARDYPDADALLEELIEDHRAPRGLVVVSSDHRVQRAARQRGAKPLDSGPWFRDLVRQHPPRPAPPSRHHPQSATRVLPHEFAYWIAQFSDAATLELETELQRPLLHPPPRQTDSKPETKPKDQHRRPMENPFPPGYGEDLLE